MEDVLGVSIVEYNGYVYMRNYEDALRCVTPEFVAVYGGSILTVTVDYDELDNPELLCRLIDLGVPNPENPLFVLLKSLFKPKTLYMLLYVCGLVSSYDLLARTVSSQYISRLVKVMVTEKTIIDSGMGVFGEDIRMALSHAKRATYALLKAYKLLGKDATRMIAKLVWGSRANINWEK